MDGKNKGLSDKLGAAMGENGKLKGDIGKLKGGLAAAKGNNGKLKGENGGLKNKVGQLEGKNKGLTNKLAAANGENGRLKGENGKLKGENGGLKNKITALGGDVRKCEGEKGGLGRDLNSCQTEGKLLAGNNLRLKNRLAGLGGDVKNCIAAKGGLGKDLFGVKGKLRDCQKSGNALAGKHGRLKGHIANIGKKINDAKNNLRANIARKLARHFKKNNIDAKVDPKTGTVTLLMDKNLLFETNSARLSKFAKSKLGQIIPVYSEVLFGDLDFKQKIAYFNVEGHASPSFGTGYVDPYKSAPEPYNYNLNLSARRANSITNYIFGHRIKEYPNKLYMRRITRSVGFGFTKPIKPSRMSRGRAPASISAVDDLSAKLGEKHNCGDYSCALSQRVEMSFTLKDDPNVFKKIFKFREGEL